MNRFSNKKILIAPYSPLTQNLSTNLKKKFNVKVLGFIDSNKIGNNIYKKEDIVNLNFDYILIYSSNHSLAIYKTLKLYTKYIY
jgi:hypothetical protein